MLYKFKYQKRVSHVQILNTNGFNTKKRVI